uniref:RING-type domain-containing protein n=1 Tax=Monopterus albus TaxID=43700 RepID=A0A3Q3QBR1_MONAL
MCYFCSPIKVLEKNSDLKTQQSFEAVIVCMGDPQDPLCLPCEHIYCVACIRQWLVPGQMYCPLCKQPV